MKPRKTGWKLTEETKKRMSESRKRLYAKNPEKCFFVSNPTRGKRNFAYKKGLERFRRATWLRKQYLEKNRTQKDIATEVGVHQTCIRKWLMDAGIALRTPLEWGKLKTGPKNGNWRGGATQTYRCGRSDTKGWRSAVLKRDDYRCVHCGSTDNLEADHIKPYVDYPELRADVSNGRTLCETCHKKVTYEYLKQRFKRK